MKKNPHDKILKKEPKKQHISLVPKSVLLLTVICTHKLYFKIYIDLLSFFEHLRYMNVYVHGFLLFFF